jgi:hypothetical protein
MLKSVLVLDAVREAQDLPRAFVVEGELLAAVPVGVEEVGVTVPTGGLEVPHELHAGLGIALAVDLVEGEGASRDPALEAVVGPDPRLAPEALGHLLELVVRRVVEVRRPDGELHPLLEEEVAVVPELLGQEGLEPVDLVEAEDVALFEGGHRTSRVFGRRGR